MKILADSIDSSAGTIDSQPLDEKCELEATLPLGNEVAIAATPIATAPNDLNTGMDKYYISFDTSKFTWSSSDISHFSRPSSDDEDRNVMLSYTMLNGLEEACSIVPSRIVKMTRRRRKKLNFTSKFPFVSLTSLLFTDLAYTEDESGIAKHIIALESPSTLAKRCGIEYEQASFEELVDSDLLGN